MEKKNLIIIGLLVIAIIALLFYIRFNINKGNKVWCNTGKSFNTITGEIVKVSTDSIEENQTGNILIKQDNGKGNIIIHHNSELKFKVGQKISVTYTGIINESNPPQIIAVCIKIIK